MTNGRIGASSVPRLDVLPILCATKQFGVSYVNVQVQVDVTEAGTEPMQKHFERWWTKAMDYWRKGAGPGDSFPFVYANCDRLVMRCQAQTIVMSSLCC